MFSDVGQERTRFRKKTKEKKKKEKKGKQQQQKNRPHCGQKWVGRDKRVS